MTTNLSDRQKEILEDSLEIIAESGIQGLTIKNLAKKIGFSESAIYRHYENKIQILVAILDYFKENSEHFFASGQEVDADAVSKIEFLFMNQFKTFVKSPSLVAVIFSEEFFRNETILFEKVSEVMNYNINMLTQIIKTGQEKREIRSDIEASYLSVIVMGALRMFVKQWHMSGYGFDLTKKGTEFISSIRKIVKK